jgi:hypothetical protein
VKPTGVDFAAGVREVFKENALRRVKIDHALHTSANYDWPQVAAVFFDLYDELYRRSRKLYAAPAEAQTRTEASVNANL